MSDPITAFKEISFAEDLVFVGAQSAGAGNGMPLQGQLTTTLAKLRSILNDGSMTFADVVKIGVFYHQSVLEEEAFLLKGLRALFPSEGPAPVVTAIPLHNLPQDGDLVQIELIALKPGSQRSAERKAASLDVVHGFSTAVRCDDLIFVGGKMSVDGEVRVLHSEDIVAQSRTTMDNLKQAIKEVGADPLSVVKLNTYYVGHGTTADWSMAAQVRSDAFVKPGPGATGVPVPGPYPDGVLLRQEAIAIVEKDGSPRHRETSWPEGVWDWPFPVSFEQGLKLGNLIVLGGQISASTTGDAVYPNDLASQTKYVMETIEKILAGFDKNCDCLEKLTILYATDGDPADQETVLKRVRPFFSTSMPTLTLIPLARIGLDGIEVEIEGIGIAD
jgi:enamine deaminase RidA (YjgF/YER057c/UK114 family)